MKKYLIISVLFMVATVALGQTVTDNPYGGLYPMHMRRAVKATPISFNIRGYSVADSGDVGVGDHPFPVLDTMTNREWLWVAPFDCKIDSFKVILGCGIATSGIADSLLDADTVAGTDKHFRWMLIHNNSAANGDTIIKDSTVSASIGTTKSALTLWTPRGGPDSTKTTMQKGKVLRVRYDPVGGPTSTMTWGCQFMVTPSDRSK